MQAVAHVRCFQQFHPPPPKLDNKEDKRRKKAEHRHEDDEVQAAGRDDGTTGAHGSSHEAATTGSEGDTPSTAAASATPDGVDGVSGASPGGREHPSTLPQLANGDHDGGGTGSTAQQSVAKANQQADVSMKAAKSDSRLADAMGGLLLDCRVMSLCACAPACQSVVCSTSDLANQSAITDRQVAKCMMCSATPRAVHCFSAGGLPPVADGTLLQTKTLAPIRTVSVRKSSASDAE